MGFRSTLITEDIALECPAWFKKKWKDQLNFSDKLKRFTNQGFVFPISSKLEAKTYGQWLELEEDLQKVLNEQDRIEDLVLVYLHECGGITRVEIHKDAIYYSEPAGWNVVDQVSHDYCYGCSDVPKPKSEESKSTGDENRQ